MMNSIIDKTNSNFLTTSSNVYKADWKAEKPVVDNMLAAYTYWLWDSD